MSLPWLASAGLGLLRKTAVPTYWLPAQVCPSSGVHRVSVPGTRQAEGHTHTQRERERGRGGRETSKRSSVLALALAHQATRPAVR